MINILRNTAFWFVEYTPSIIVNFPVLKIITKPTSDYIVKPIFTMLKDNYKDIIITPFWAPIALFKERKKIKDDIFFLSKNVITGSITTAKKAIDVIDDSAFWFTEYITDIISNFPILNIITNQYFVT